MVVILARVVERIKYVPMSARSQSIRNAKFKEYHQAQHKNTKCNIHTYRIQIVMIWMHQRYYNQVIVLWCLELSAQVP
jgi:hypothetical protein